MVKSVGIARRESSAVSGTHIYTALSGSRYFKPPVLPVVLTKNQVVVMLYL